MNRCIFALLTAFIITSSFAQSDFIQLKKRGQVLETWFKDNYIYLQQKNGQWINAKIYKIEYDSLYLRPYIVRTFINRLGLNFLDTAYYGLMPLSVHDIRAFPKENESLGYVKNGAILKIGGGGYLLLNVINTLGNNEPVFGSGNVPKIGIAAGVIAIGTIIGLMHSSTYIIGKKYRIEYISSKPS